MENFYNSYLKIDADDAETFSDPLPTVLACMQPELHAFKVLFYAEYVGVVTFGHATKMAVTPFVLQFPKTHAIRKPHDSIFYRTGVIAG